MEKKKMNIELETDIYKKLLELSRSRGETLECLVEEFLEEKIDDCEHICEVTYVQRFMEAGYIEMRELNSQLSEQTLYCDEEELEDYEMNLMGSE